MYLDMTYMELYCLNGSGFALFSFFLLILRLTINYKMTSPKKILTSLTFGLDEFVDHMI